MITINLSPEALPLLSNPLPLGIRGENEVTQVVLDFSSWVQRYGSGIVSLQVRRKSDSAAYPVALTQSGTEAVWTVSQTDLAIQGDCRAEYVYTIGTAIKKSCVLYYHVLRDIGDGGPAPDPYEDWLETLQQLAAQTQQNALDAEAASEAIQDMDVDSTTLPAGSAPTVTKTVDPETGAVTLTFGLAPGENGQDGFSPTVEVEEITGGHSVTITDAEGEHSFDVMDGEDGDENVFIAIYGVTSASDVYDAVQAGKVCFARDYITVAPLIGAGMIGEDRYYAAFAFVSNGEQITYTVTGTTWSEQSAQLAHGTYVHTQSQAAAEWTIVHSLRCYPSVTVIDSGGSVCVGEVQYLDSNTVKVTFQAAFSGKAYLN